MTSANIKIVLFADKYQADIDIFMAQIKDEFVEDISIRNPDSKKISELALRPNERYWVALSSNKAIGTLGLIVIASDIVVLKRMFILSEFRGKGVAKRMLDTTIDWAQANGVRSIYLGTMSQFKAAQKFYEKHGFKVIEKNKLPNEFPINPVDSIFYRMKLG